MFGTTPIAAPFTEANNQGTFAVTNQVGATTAEVNCTSVLRNNREAAQASERNYRGMIGTTPAVVPFT